jgi:HD-GYP domain-containing protein (c-di-GMP phosphodiesterase class II)
MDFNLGGKRMMDKKPNSNNKFLGAQLKQDLFNKTGILIAPAKTVLKHEQVRMMELHGISLIPSDVYLPGSFLNEVRPQAEQDALIEESVKQMGEIFQYMRYSQDIPFLDIQQSIIPIIHEATEQPNLFNLFATLQSKDDYTYRHSIGVGVIATLIGRWLGIESGELAQLTMAAALHDIGKVKIPLDILNKPGKLTDEEYTTMKQHARFGYEMIKATPGNNHRQALVALQHHERQDGSGYPIGMRAEKIDSHSRIVAVADVFHAMTSDRAYRNASPFYETLKQMHHNAFGEFDANIIHLFLDKMMQSLIGNEVMFSDGRSGHIIMINHHDPLLPLVRIEQDIYVDLSKQSSVHIDHVIV